MGLFFYEVSFYMLNNKNFNLTHKYQTKYYYNALKCCFCMHARAREVVGVFDACVASFTTYSHNMTFHMTTLK